MMRSSAMLSVLSGVIAASLAGCLAPPPMPPEYAPPQPGLVITYAEEPDGNGDGKPATTRHRIVRNVGDRVVDVVTTSPDGAERETRNLRGIATYQIWQKGQGVVVEDIRKNPIRDLWPLSPDNWSVTEGPTYVGQGATREAALKKVQRTGTIKHTYRVLRHDTVTVPAGSYEAIVIRRETTVRKSDGAVDPATQKTYWFVPSLGWAVRVDTVTKRQDQPDREERMVATSVTRPTATKPPASLSPLP